MTLVVGVRAGGGAVACEHHQHCPRSWVPLAGRGRPEVPRHMHPSGHGEVSGVHDGDGRRTDRRTTRERARHRCLGQACSAASDGAWGVGHGAAADECVVREGARTNERPRCCVRRRANKDERVGIRFSVSERQREMGPARAEPRPDKSHGRTTVAYHYCNL